MNKTDNTDKTTETKTKQITLDDLSKVRGGDGSLRAGGRGSYKGSPHEFPTVEV